MESEINWTHPINCQIRGFSCLKTWSPCFLCCVSCERMFSLEMTSSTFLKWWSSSEHLVWNYNYPLTWIYFLNLYNYLFILLSQREAILPFPLKLPAPKFPVSLRKLLPDFPYSSFSLPLTKSQDVLKSL